MKDQLKKLTAIVSEMNVAIAEKGLYSLGEADEFGKRLGAIYEALSVTESAN